MDALSSLQGLSTNQQNTSSSGSGDLGQADFLELMVTQLQNQDPFKPMENGDFLAQMAQFSTVSGIEQLNSTMSDIGSQLGGSRITDAAHMLGRSVLVPGTVVRPNINGAVLGAVELRQPSTAVSIRYTDAKTSETLHIQELGPQASGQLNFKWDDVPEPLVEARDGIRVTVDAEGAGLVDTFVYARIEGVNVADSLSGEFTFTVEDYGLHSSLEIDSIR